MRLIMAALFGLVLFFAAIGDVGAEDAIQIERLAVEQRLKIKSWHVVVDSSVELFHPGEKHKSETVKYVYYADNDRKTRRRDITQSKQSKDNNPAKMVVTKEIWSDYYYYFCDEIYVNPSAEEMVQPVRVDEKGDIPAGTVPPIDVRLIGFLPTGLLFDGNVTDTVGSTNSFRMQGDPSATFKSVVDESFDGIPCKKTVWVFAKGRTITTWIAPSLGFTPICMEYRSENEEICRTTVQLMRYKETEIWFPTSSIFEEYDK
ncbi:hypothetical protein FACS1894189_8470 [Planctomycetales bacterium]|nr:hypothetical protein FACS1894189_8470 [Planctomycetales bacterium]